MILLLLLKTPLIDKKIACVRDADILLAVFSQVGQSLRELPAL